jgi:DNA gyrase subunit A
MEIPSLANSTTALGLKGGGSLKEFVTLEKKETPLALMNLDEETILAVGSLQGVVKRVAPEVPKGDVWEIIRLDNNDRLVGAGVVTAEDQHLVFITTDCQLLHFEAGLVRPQGRGAGGMAGINLAKGTSVLMFAVANSDSDVLTVSGSSSALPGTDPGSAKITPLSQFPTKGRATGGVRCHSLRKSEDTLLLAAVGQSPLRAATENGVPLELTLEPAKRDGTGTALTSTVGAAAGRLPL